MQSAIGMRLRILSRVVRFLKLIDEPSVTLLLLRRPELAKATGRDPQLGLPVGHHWELLHSRTVIGHRDYSFASNSLNTPVCCTRTLTPPWPCGSTASSRNEPAVIHSLSEGW